MGILKTILRESKYEAYNDRQYFEENAIILSDNKQMQTDLEEEYNCIM